MRLPSSGRSSTRDGAAQFDGQIGDAAARVDLIGRDDGPGRADIDAGLATAAVFADRGVDRQRQVGVELAEKEPGTGLAVEQIGVLADPAEPGLLAPGPSPAPGRSRRRPGSRTRRPARRCARPASAAGYAAACGSRDRARSARRRPRPGLPVVLERRRSPARPRRADSPSAPRSPAVCRVPVRPGASACCRGGPCSPSRRESRR